MSDQLTEKVEAALEEIRPFLISDGGNVSLVKINNNIVTIRLEGTCIDCKINHMTLKLGIEETIKKHAPSIQKVVNIGLPEN